MNRKIRKPWVTWFMVLFSVALFAVVVLKALKMAVTHDEAYTYLYYVKQTWAGILLYKPPHIPNNHILNTLLIKVSTGLFGLSAFTLRLPNILFSVMYFWYAAAIGKTFRFPAIQVMAYLILVMQIFFFDFFPLARGYGMGLALSLASLYHLHQYRELNNGHHIWRTLIFGAFAVYANFTFLYAYLGLITLLVILWVAEYQKNEKPIGILLRPVIIVTAILTLFVFIPLRNISGSLFGADSNFWDSSAGTLIWSLSYGQFPESMSILKFVLAIILLVGAILWITDVFKNKEDGEFWFYKEILMLLVITAVGQIMQHYLLGTEFLVGRTTLVYAPMLLVFFLFLFQRMRGFEPWGEKLQTTLNAVLLALLIFNFKAIDFKDTFEWAYDAGHKELLKDLKQQKETLGLEQVKLGINWLYEPSLNFYREAEELSWLEKLNRDGAENTAAHFYYLKGDKDLDLIKAAEEKSWQKINQYESGAILYYNPNYL